MVSTFIARNYNSDPSQQAANTQMTMATNDLVDVMDVGESVELGVHGVEHMDDVNGLADGADVREGHHVAEQDGAHVELT